MTTGLFNLIALRYNILNMIYRKKNNFLVICFVLFLNSCALFPTDSEKSRRLPSAEYSYQTQLRQNSALVDQGGKCPPANQSLYRGIRGNYFNAIKIIKNMLGDETEEHFSWRLTNILKERFSQPYTVDDVHNAKLLAFTELKQKTSKASNICGLTFSVETHIVEEHKNSLGIPSSLSFDVAAAYVSLFGGSEGAILKIDEKIPRAGRDFYMWKSQGEAEYYFPIYIPNDDITAAWVPGLFIEKTSSANGIEIKVHEYLWQREKSPIQDGPTLFSIQMCMPDKTCESDLKKTTSEKANQIMPALADYIRQRGYRIVVK